MKVYQQKETTTFFFILFNVQADPSGGWENEKITKALWDEMIADLTGLCRKAAEVNTLTQFFQQSLKLIYLFILTFLILRNCCVPMHFLNVPS